MRLTNHIAYRLLNDEKLLWEILELVHPNIWSIEKKGDIPDDIKATYGLLSNTGNKSYYITESVTEKLELLKVKRKEGRYDYTIFNSLQPQKCTFILPGNKVVRMLIATGPDAEAQMVFDYIRFIFDKGNKNHGVLNNCIFYVNRTTGEQCSHFEHADVKEIEDYLYKLLCFIYLSETEELILKPGQKMGTRKSGKVINEIKQDLIVVTSKWNITSVRTEGFAVSGHFRLLKPNGTTRLMTTVTWVNPFEKKGYVRRASKETQTSDHENSSQ